MKYKGIIFDLDGTLANTLDDIAGSMNSVLTAHHYPAHPVNDYKLLVGRGLENLVLNSLPVQARLPALVSKCLAEMIENYNDNCLVNTHLYEGIREMLDGMIKHQLKLAVFSNKAEPLTHKIVTHLLGDVPFVSIMGARSDFPRKPDPAGAFYISRQMEVPPQQIVYMGDSDVDMITAIKAGMFAVGVLWGFRSGEELRANGANVLLDHPSGLVPLLEN